MRPYFYFKYFMIPGGDRHKAPKQTVHYATPVGTFRITMNSAPWGV